MLYLYIYFAGLFMSLMATGVITAYEEDTDYLGAIIGPSIFWPVSLPISVGRLYGGKLRKQRQLMEKELIDANRMLAEHNVAPIEPGEYRR